MVLQELKNGTSKNIFRKEIFLEDMCPVVLSKTVWGMCCMKDAKYDM